MINFKVFTKNIPHGTLITRFDIVSEINSSYFVFESNWVKHNYYAVFIPSGTCKF